VPGRLISSPLIANRGARFGIFSVDRAAIRSSAALLLLLADGANAASAGAGDRAKIEQVIRSVMFAEDGKDIGVLRDSTWPDGHFAVRSAGKTRTAFETQRWEDFTFGGTGVNYSTRITGMNIRVHGATAVAEVRETSRRYYSDEFSGLAYRSRNQITLTRRHGQWRVLDWERTVRQFGSDAAWHRRHP
jgi:SnoaL-like domain